MRDEGQFDAEVAHRKLARERQQGLFSRWVCPLGDPVASLGSVKVCVDGGELLCQMPGVRSVPVGLLDSIDIFPTNAAAAGVLSFNVCLRYVNAKCSRPDGARHSGFAATVSAFGNTPLVVAVAGGVDPSSIHFGSRATAVAMPTAVCLADAVGGVPLGSTGSTTRSSRPLTCVLTVTVDEAKPACISSGVGFLPVSLELEPPP